MSYKINFYENKVLCSYAILYKTFVISTLCIADNKSDFFMFLKSVVSSNIMAAHWAGMNNVLYIINAQWYKAKPAHY